MASAALPLTEVKLLARGGEMYVLAKSRARREKEHAMRRRRLRALWDGLVKLRQHCSSRDPNPCPSSACGGKHPVHSQPVNS